ncbi:DUF397 domain-containing protein [Nocardiopsis suaedae]|uniref:DUF397 domain-containing protein n=1 Tax=Nocardiopsis suaedae TaxID=3018444 RepID=A0ABT4TKU3_9ACTN|nr:DUF397 domain-containing protein [Nocardiopsis suaedae]MDA2805322.1 DUF397 domain-containing protein [Nocardiopsis suaedae]
MLPEQFGKSPYSQAQGDCVAARIDDEGWVEVQDTVNPDRVLGLPSAERVALLRAHGRSSAS